jgi:exopolyphosphatase/guanosine-5'-triphosphate,3'-diphosphate pyrophosphatase
MPEPPIQRIAGIDLGSNSLKLAIAAAQTGRLPEMTIRHRIPLRLATDAFDGGCLHEGTIDRLLTACQRFAEILDRVRIVACRTVATEAFRRIDNAVDVIERISDASGLTVEVLTPEEEIGLVLGGVTAHLPDGLEPDLLVDLGGGSLDIVVPPGEEGGDLRIENHPLGLAALFETFLDSREPGRETRQELSFLASKLAAELTSHLLDALSPETIVLSGGQAAMLDNLAIEWGFWEYDASSLSSVTPERFRSLSDRMVREEILTLISFGIPPDRASMLAGAAAFYHTLADRCGAASIIISRAGLMDGLLPTVLEQGSAWPPADESRG